MTLKDAWVPGYICTNRHKDQGPRGKRDNNQVISHREYNKDSSTLSFEPQSRVYGGLRSLCCIKY